MGFTFRDIRRVLDAFDNSDWDEIHLSDGADELHLVAVGAAASVSPASITPVAPASAPPPAVPAAPTPPISMPAATRTPAPAPGEASRPAVAPEGVAVAAPSMGVFYRAPSPGAPPFVEVGDEVDAQTTVCVVEVMKLMNPVQAGVAGTVAAVHLANAERVTAGQAMFTIRPTA